MIMKVAYSGTHGTGKTTACFELARMMKIQFSGKTVGLLHENAARSPYPINKDTTPESQLWIFSNQLSEELELATKYDILVCDRTVLDAVAYTFVAGFEELAQAMLKLAAEHMSSYDDIIYRGIEHEYAIDDGVRDVQTLGFREQVDECLQGLYRLLGISCKRSCNGNEKEE